MINGLIIYTKPNCTKCMMTKHYAAQLGFEYEVRDIFDQDNNMYDDVKKLINDYGLYIAPIVIAVKDGVRVEYWSDFRVDKLKYYVGVL